MYRKIDVSASEMMTLREQGLSNHDIAKSLDVSPETVRRYIGKQCGRMEGLAALKDTPPKRKIMVKENKEMPEIPKYEPKAIKENYKVGKMQYELNHITGIIGIYDGHTLITVPYNELPDIVQFLAWAMRERIDTTAKPEVMADAEDDEVREQEDYDWSRDI